MVLIVKYIIYFMTEKYCGVSLPIGKLFSTLAEYKKFVVEIQLPDNLANKFIKILIFM